MKSPPIAALGATRTCPHCKAKILKSAVACPACHHFLRFEAVKGAQKPRASIQPLRVEWTIRERAVGGPCEYSVMFSIHDERGEEINRQVAAVGALAPAEVRTVKIWMEIYLPGDA